MQSARPPTSRHVRTLFACVAVATLVVAFVTLHYTENKSLRITEVVEPIVSFSIDKKESLEPPVLQRPITIGCIGMMRSGSTVAFNLMKELIEAIDPNLLSGYLDTVEVEDPTSISNMISKAHGKVSYY